MPGYAPDFLFNCSECRDCFIDSLMFLLRLKTRCLFQVVNVSYILDIKITLYVFNVIQDIVRVKRIESRMFSIEAIQEVFPQHNGLSSHLNFTCTITQNTQHNERHKQKVAMNTINKKNNILQIRSRFSVRHFHFTSCPVV